MKALTLTQPYATLVALGMKKIETRSWKTSYRGSLAIHAATRLGPVGGRIGLRRIWGTEPFRSALWDYETPDALPRGAIVAVCELLDCVPTWPDWATESPWFTGVRKGVRKGVGQHYYEVPPPQDSNERAFGDYTPGRYAWLLAKVRMLPEPIPVKGALGLWEWSPPEGVEL